MEDSAGNSSGNTGSPRDHSNEVEEEEEKMQQQPLQQGSRGGSAGWWSFNDAKVHQISETQAMSAQEAVSHCIHLIGVLNLRSMQDHIDFPHYFPERVRALVPCAPLIIDCACFT